MAWLLLILATPVPGFLTFVSLGTTVSGAPGIGASGQPKTPSCSLPIRVLAMLHDDAPVYVASVVRLNDTLASQGLRGYRQLVHRLDGTRIQAHAMLPIQPLRRRFRRPDLRNHRKLLVVDGRIGTADVLTIEAAPALDTVDPAALGGVTGQLEPSGPGYPSEKHQRREHPQVSGISAG